MNASLKKVPKFFLALIFLFLVSCSGKSSTRYYEEAPLLLPQKSQSSQKEDRKFPLTPWVKEEPLIVIDPGHGGKDMGTQSIKGPKYYEKNLTLSTCHTLSLYLNMLGFKTKMTREKDEFIELQERAHCVSNKKPIAFVSVHFNSAPSKQAEGIEIYYYQSETNSARTASSKELAEKVLSSILSYTKAKSRGVKQGNFLVIRESKFPAIIVEGGFMTNEEEMKKLSNPSYLKKLAWGIAEGIKNFYK